jgi:glycosyltransferase involved in cell wall biosynthesis
METVFSPQDVSIEPSINPTLAQVRENYHLLESPNFATPPNVRLISNVVITEKPGLKVQTIAPNRWVRFFRWYSPLFCFFHALQIWFTADRKTVILIDGGANAVWLLLGLLNWVFSFRKRTLFLWELHAEYMLGTEKRFRLFPFLRFKTSWKEAIARNALLGYDLLAVYSWKQVISHVTYYRLPPEKLIFLPYKANHSKKGPLDLPIGNFLFSGGNSKRDYQCLLDAVRGTNIPVIISVTNPQLRNRMEYLPNVMVLEAREPAFAQLQAACSFAVVPVTSTGIKAGGETNICNAMWHGKAVIASCSMAAEDYILEGETGYVVPSGDSRLLRQRILELWNNPERAADMGKKAHAHVEANFTHDLFILRLLRLALILGDEKMKG